MEERNELTLPCGDIALTDDGGILLRNVGDALRFASLCAKGDFLPKNVSPIQGTLAILAGRKFGMDPFASFQNIAVINGRPTIWGDAVGALCASSGLLEDEWHEEVGEGEEFKVVYHVVRKGRKHEIVRSFSYREAKVAGLIGKSGPWTTYPKRMMFNRARAFAYRDAFPDILKGVGITEEARDAEVIEVPVASEEPLQMGVVKEEAHTPAMREDGREVKPKQSATQLLKRAVAQAHAQEVQKEEAK